MINPSKHIRKFFFDRLNNIVVDGKVITIHDYRIPENKNAYILMINQSMSDGQNNKCDVLTWDARITLDVVTIYDNVSGSRLLADDIMERVMNETQSINIGFFTVDKVSVEYPDDIQLMTPTQNIYRKIIQYNFKLTQI